MNEGFMICFRGQGQGEHKSEFSVSAVLAKVPYLRVACPGPHRELCSFYRSVSTLSVSCLLSPMILYPCENLNMEKGKFKIKTNEYFKKLCSGKIV